MKTNNKLFAMALATTAVGLVACDNQDIDFPDYEGGVSIYFPYQTPVRTIVLGSDEYDTSLDKEHKCLISATMGGAYKGRNIIADYVVDEKLCQNVKKVDGSAIKVMPSSYYTLSDEAFRFNGNQKASIEVQLTDAFFADPESVNETYVIPMYLRNQIGADRILTGSYDTEIYSTAPSRLDAEKWSDTDKPMDYILYCVKYQNKYTGSYARCGKYKIDGAAAIQLPNDSVAKWVGHFNPVTDGVACKIATRSLKQATYKLTLESKPENLSVDCSLLLTFDDSDNCTITSETEGVTVTGTGKFVANGATKAWGNKDRDLLTLNFTIDNGTQTIVCEESLVWTNSNVNKKEFELIYVAE